VAHHLRREAVSTGAAALERTYVADLAGFYLDIRGQRATRADIYVPDSYAASQALGECIRAVGGAGIIYDSVRHAGGTNVVAHHPRNVLAVMQTDHWTLTVRADTPRIDLRKLRVGAA
jgi:hypothetical protein